MDNFQVYHPTSAPKSQFLSYLEVTGLTEFAKRCRKKAPLFRAFLTIFVSAGLSNLQKATEVILPDEKGVVQIKDVRITPPIR